MQLDLAAAKRALDLFVTRFWARMIISFVYFEVYRAMLAHRARKVVARLRGGT